MTLGRNFHKSCVKHGGSGGENRIFAILDKPEEAFKRPPPPLPPPAAGRRLTRSALGYPAEREALGVNITTLPAPEPLLSEGTSEVAIESSQHEDSYELLKLS